MRFPFSPCRVQIDAIYLSKHEAAYAILTHHVDCDFGLHDVVFKEWISVMDPWTGFLLIDLEMMSSRNQKQK
ncbi:hypothetical protein KIN20_024614 [Parelaphostrongylus tenuis]|uniref:Uncharacterized protein n=1 Tax=Parelaphostrongylus tenuis TaxID=148309 RepID=A0AAD5QWD9_PARTN|nr:hypothetical protein KIN20_024608 [Parelaphostrongylus tenuis]KAJ1364497.1 hypothetical protein KIN20_024614 [Parelaphostrongylus tenuis]